jgi:PIN like domain
MRILLDEDVPVQVLDVLAHVLRGHDVNHVHRLKWSGKKDLYLFDDASKRFDMVVTNNYKQFDDPEETRRIKKSGLHHVAYRQRHDGLKGLALSIGAIVAAMPLVVDELVAADGQRLVAIHGLEPKSRYTIKDPKRDPPKYWPR